MVKWKTWDIYNSETDETRIKGGKMKTIFLILVLISVNLYSQDSLNNNTQTLGLFPQSNYRTVENELLRILEQYERECYADSTEISESYWDENYLLAKRKVWIHRELTFAGFIEFLRKKDLKKG